MSPHHNLNDSLQPSLTACVGNACGRGRGSVARAAAVARQGFLGVEEGRKVRREKIEPER